MPEKIKGKKLTAKDHRQYRHVKESTGSYAAATAVVKKTMAKRGKKK
jgi:hypothetical protein